MTEKVKYWLDLAYEDINVAEVLLSGKKYLYAGFMCHLSVEKALKSKIESMGETPLKIHNLIRLAEMGGILDLMDDGQKILLADLNPLQIEARYPAYKKKIENTMTAHECTEFIKQSKGMIQWTEQQL